VSKTTQRRAAAFSKGYADARANKPSKWTGHRSLKKQYVNGHQIGVMDRQRNHRIRMGIPDPPRDDWGPEPTQHEVARPYRGF
jgi:hypothetical protein